MFKMFKPFNRFAEPVLSKVEGLKPFKTDSVPDIGPFKVQRETGLLHGVPIVPIVSVVPVVPVDPMVPEFQFEIPFAPWRLCERNDFFVLRVLLRKLCDAKARRRYPIPSPRRGRTKEGVMS